MWRGQAQPTVVVGPAAVWGDVLRGMEAYFAHINEKGGIHGRKIEFVSLDDGDFVGVAQSKLGRFAVDRIAGWREVRRIDEYGRVGVTLQVRGSHVGRDVSFHSPSDDTGLVLAYGQQGHFLGFEDGGTSPTEKDVFQHC